MKIAITGHSEGIGNDIYLNLIKEYDVIGFSRSNGFNIKNTDKIIEQLENCDVFINNTYEKNYQTILFELIFDKWKFLPKTIIPACKPSNTPLSSQNKWINKIH